MTKRTFLIQRVGGAVEPPNASLHRISTRRRLVVSQKGDWIFEMDASTTPKSFHVSLHYFHKPSSNVRMWNDNTKIVNNSET
jgi:hypothetical protein